MVIHLARIAPSRQRLNRRIGALSVFAMWMLRRPQQRNPGNRCADSGDHPGGEEREGHHREQGKRVLAGVTAREADRHECRNGDERAGKSGIRGGRISEDGGLRFVVAALQPANQCSRW